MCVCVCSLSNVKRANNAFENVMKFEYFENIIQIKIVFMKK
jgi:hypothetical protein